MHHFITPSEYQELIKRKSVAQMIERSGWNPSKLTLYAIMGYSAALKVFYTQPAGKISVLLN